MGGNAMTSVVGGVLCVLLVAVVIWVVAAYNRLVRLRNQADASWAQIDVQLKRRYDLIPHLIDSVQVYTAYERDTLDAVMAARGAAMNLAQGAGPAARADAENALSRALGRLIAVAETYPHLKASHNFAALQVELTNTEDKIAYARQLFAGAVQSYNYAVQTLPTNLIAGVTGFRGRQFFRAPGDERGPVQVRF
jgi:LemA protein